MYVKHQACSHRGHLFDRGRARWLRWWIGLDGCRHPTPHDHGANTGGSARDHDRGHCHARHGRRRHGNEYAVAHASIAQLQGQSHAQAPSTHGRRAALIGGSTLAAPPSSSAYYTDPQSSHVEDATSRGIQQVNMITCLMNAMRADAMVNEGEYVALVDVNRCDPRAQASSAPTAASSGASQAVSYSSAIVDSSRDSNSDPMRVRAWLTVSEDGFDETIFINTSASAAPSTAAPYGVFRLDYCGAGAQVGSCMMQGYLESSTDGLSYFEQEQGDDDGGSVALRLSSVGSSSGSGRLQIDEGAEPMTFQFAFDATHFRRAMESSDQCFIRDASDPDTGFSVWRYGLYDATTGARITRNSGFPIEYESTGQTYHGYLSYWGLSLPPAALQTLTSGSTVQKVEYAARSEPTRTPYTLVRAEGKLTKYTRHTRTLESIDGVRFTVWVGDATGFYSGAESNQNYIVYWDDTAGTFKAVATQVCDESGCNPHALSTVQTVSAGFFSAQGGARGWSEALGGEVFIDLGSVGSTIDSTQVNVVYREATIVYPDQMPATLYCLQNCPTATAMAGYFQPGTILSSPFVPETYNRYGPATSAVTYTTNAQAGTLQDDTGAAVTFTNREAIGQNNNYSWGIRTGRLFTDLNAVQCSHDPSQYCEWQIESADVYYGWETGPDSWNQFAAVKGSDGAYVQFEAPLQVTYHVPDGARYGEYAGRDIVLQYGGFGDLNGIPGRCVSALTNEPAACTSDGSTRYVPSFVIPMDETTGRVTAGETTYLVKWLNREIRFALKDDSECAALTLPGSEVALPTDADLENPADPGSLIYIGEKPTLTSAPRVIQGEVQY